MSALPPSGSPFQTSGLDPDLVAAWNPHTSFAELARIAGSRSDLHPAIAANPGTPPELLQWLTQSPDPAVHAALAARSGAPTQMWGSAPPSTAPVRSPVQAPAGPSTQPAVQPSGAPSAQSSYAPPITPVGGSVSPPAGRHHIRGLLVGLLAAALVLAAGGVGAWWFLLRDRYSVPRYGLSNSFHSGAKVAWSTTDHDSSWTDLSADGKYLANFGSGDSDSSTNTVTFQSVSPARTTTLASATYPDDPKVLGWFGERFAIADQLVDPTTGNASTAPWAGSSDTVTLVAGELAVVCGSGTCHGIDSSGRQLWADKAMGTPTDNVLDSAAGVLTITVDGSGTPTILNVETGQLTGFSGYNPSVDYSSAYTVTDGWVFSTSTDSTRTSEGWGIDGTQKWKVPSSSVDDTRYSVTPGAADRSLAEMRSDLEGSTAPSGSATVTVSADCASLDVDGTTIALPSTPGDDDSICQIYSAWLSADSSTLLVNLSNQALLLDVRKQQSLWKSSADSWGYAVPFAQGSFIIRNDGGISCLRPIS